MAAMLLKFEEFYFKGGCLDLLFHPQAAQYLRGDTPSREATRLEDCYTPKRAATPLRTLRRALPLSLDLPPPPLPLQETAFTLLELRDMMAAARLQPVSVFFASLQQDCRRTLVRCTLDALCAR